MKLGQVRWGHAVEALVGQNAELEGDALSDWQPMPQIRSTILALYKLVCMYVCMYVAQYMTDGIEVSGVDNQAGGGVLDKLRPLRQKCCLASPVRIVISPTRISKDGRYSKL